MREIDVRESFFKTEIARIERDTPGSLVVNELGILEGKYRVDVAVVNGLLHGYEIKSASDNLERLPGQQDNYGKVFDKMTLVADVRHVVAAVKLVPRWWGLIAVSSHEGAPVLEEIWPARQNFHVDAYALCQLLWREEALAILASHGLDRGLRTKPRKALWEALSRQLEINQLRAVVRRMLKSRKDWRR